MAASFIGKAISLTSHSDIRYRGILAGIDTTNSTIQLSQVYSLGTEHRKSAEQFVPPNPVPYQYIVFRAAEVKDLAVESEDTAQRDAVVNDPAVVGAAPQAFPNQQQSSSPAPVTQQPTAATGRQRVAPANHASAPHATNHRRQAPDSARRGMENVERAMNDLHQNKQTLSIPTEDFDFQTSNARFDKSSLASPVTSPLTNDDDQGSPSGEKKSYDKSKSFFDSFDSGGAPGTQLPSQSREARNERKQRREEERNRNMSTFGEALPMSTSIAQRTGQWTGGLPQTPHHQNFQPGGRGRGRGNRGGPGRGRGAPRGNSGMAMRS